MKKITCLFIMIFVLSLTSASAFALTYPHREGRVEITLPDNWKDAAARDDKASDAGIDWNVTARGDDMRAEVKGDKADDNLTIDLELVKADDLEKSIEEAQKWISRELGPIKSLSTSEIEINGMMTYIEDFSAREGKMSVSIALMLTPAGKFLCLYCFATAEAEKKYEKVLVDIISSIKPLSEGDIEKK